jgi:hypothetical protein
MYKVLYDFIDIDGVAYYKGDSYPLFSFLINQEHINYLLSNENKAGKALIEKVKSEETEEGVEKKEDDSNSNNKSKSSEVEVVDENGK